MATIRPEDTARTLLRRNTRTPPEQPAGATELLEAAREHIPAIAAALGARRVYLFGSLVWGGAHATSDLDVAVEGLGSALRAVFTSRLWDAVGQPPDVVLLETAAETLRQRVLAQGVLVYDRGEEAKR